jgi:glycosyltransferase involved in cell wall biosynthesis
MSENSSISISVCVPTRNRPNMLIQCLASIVTQSVLPSQIIVGDDSDDNISYIALQGLTFSNSVELLYVDNDPNLGQSRNIQNLFQRAKGDWILLIHDDDWLLPEALANLTAPIRAGRILDVVYGDQLIASADGGIDQEASRHLNAAFYRTPDRHGFQDDPVWSAVLGQFPNNGFLVRRALALSVGYHNDAVRDGCDYRFGVELAMAGARFFYVPKNTAVYRKSKISIARNSFRITTAPIDCARTIATYSDRIALNDVAIRKFARSSYYRAAIWCALRRGHRREALRWVFDQRVGIPFFSREMIGVATAFLVPGLRQWLKRLKNVRFSKRQ